jgi:hypothetical protein
MEWITANLTDMMSAYWWVIVGTVIGTSAIMLGLVAPIAERLEDAHSALVFQATHRCRVRSVEERSRRGVCSVTKDSTVQRKGRHELQGASS